MDSYSHVLLSTTYFGPVSYFARLFRSELALVDAFEHYIKQTYRNRCRIMTANGPQDLIIPVIKVDGNHTRVKDILITYAEKWQLNHWRTIESAYNKSPYFLYYREEIEQLIHTRSERLLDFNTRLLRIIFQFIGDSPEMQLSNQYISSPSGHMEDLRNSFSPKARNKMQMPEYNQVFIEKHGFRADLSILDLLFNLGPDTKEYLEKIDFKR